jgi:hypothetical protein
MSKNRKSCSPKETKIKPATGKVHIRCHPDGTITIDLPREDTLDILSAAADYEVENSLCG